MYSNNIESKTAKRFGQTATSHSFQKTEFNQMIQEIVSLRDKGILSEDEFEKLIRVIGANFIERKLSNKINRAVEDKILPAFLRSLNFAR